MNNQYSVTFKGKTTNVAVMVAYGENGLLRSVDFGAQDISVEATRFCYSHIPMEESELGQLGYIALIEQVPQDLSFNAFWEKYGNKQNRDRAFKFWSALPEPDRVAALRAIRRYDQYLAQKPNQDKKYPDTWLKNRCWTDEYKIK